MVHNIAVVHRLSELASFATRGSEAMELSNGLRDLGLAGRKGGSSTPRPRWQKREVTM
jgi:hypothetical protein